MESVSGFGIILTSRKVWTFCWPYTQEVSIVAFADGGFALVGAETRQEALQLVVSGAKTTVK